MESTTSKTTKTLTLKDGIKEAVLQTLLVTIAIAIGCLVAIPIQREAIQNHGLSTGIYTCLGLIPGVGKVYIFLAAGYALLESILSASFAKSKWSFLHLAMTAGIMYGLELIFR